MNRSMKYEMLRVKRYTMGLLTICIAVTILLVFGNIITGEGKNIVFGNTQHMGYGKMGVSVVQANLIILGICLIASRFLFISHSLPLNLYFSITRKEFFKTLILENFMMVSILSLFITIVLKIEPLFINIILKNKPGYVYLNRLGNLDIVKDSIFKIGFNTFFIFLAITVMWTFIALFIELLGAKGIFILLGINVILDGINIAWVQKIREYISIENIGDGIERLDQLVIGIVVMIVTYVLIYAMLLNTELKGE